MQISDISPWSTPTTCDNSRYLPVGMVDGSCYLFHALLSGDQAQGRTWVEVVEGEAQEAAAAQFIHQQDLTLFKHVWGAQGRQDESEATWLLVRV